MKVSRSTDRDCAFEEAVDKKDQGNEHPSADEGDADFENADVPLAA